MAADTFIVPSYNEPAVYVRNTVAPIVRSTKFELANLTGIAGSAADPIETNDVFKIFKMPPDVKVIRAKVASEALDSATSLDMDLQLTNGTTTKDLFNGLTVVRAGGIASSEDASVTGLITEFTANSGIGWVIDNDNYWIQLKAIAGSAGAGAGDGITVRVEYVSALESDEAQFND